VGKGNILQLCNLSATTWLSKYQKNIHPLTPTVVIDHPLSASSIYYDPWHHPYLIYVPNSLFPQSLSKFSLVYLSEKLGRTWWRV